MTVATAESPRVIVPWMPRQGLGAPSPWPAHARARIETRKRRRAARTERLRLWASGCPLLPEGVGHGQVLDPGDEVGLGPLGGAFELDVVDLLHELAEHGAELPPGELCAQAEVGPDAEGEQLVGVGPADVE